MPTEPGAIDDNALKRAKDKKKKQEADLKKVFSDNTSNRYSDAQA
jgi:hypothetical protein